MLYNTVEVEGIKLALRNLEHQEKKCREILLSFTKGRSGLDENGSAYTVDVSFTANFAKENERNLELYSNAARERLLYSMAKKCSEELSDMLWEK